MSDHRLRRDIELIRERMERGVISEVRWISTKQMLADPLTKVGVDCRKLDIVLQSGKHVKI